jgi:phosphoglycolate phosphatase
MLERARHHTIDDRHGREASGGELGCFLVEEVMDALLFDLDGTLLDSALDVALSAAHAREAVGLPPRPLEEIRGFIGEGAQRLIERTLGPEHPELIQRGLAAWHEHYTAHMLDHTRAFPGIAEAVAALEGPRAVVTNKPGPSARTLIEALGLAALFPVVVGGGDAPSRKPDAAPVRAALERLPRCERAILVGDSAIDARTAVAAGIPFVGVLWGLGKREEMERAGARWFAEKVEELPRAIHKALERPEAT